MEHENRNTVKMKTNRRCPGRQTETLKKVCGWLGCQQPPPPPTHTQTMFRTHPAAHTHKVRHVRLQLSSALFLSACSPLSGADCEHGVCLMFRLVKGTSYIQTRTCNTSFHTPRLGPCTHRNQLLAYVSVCMRV